MGKENIRFNISFENRDSADGKTKICKVLEENMQITLNFTDSEKAIRAYFEPIEIEIQEIKIKGFQIKDNTFYKQYLGETFGKEKATVVIDEEGHIYYKDEKTGEYVYDSTITNIDHYKKIFETLKAKEE